MARESTIEETDDLLGGVDPVGVGGEAIQRTDALPVGNLFLPNRVFLAPLSGISDVPFRRLARRFGAGMVVSEMVASAEFVRGHPESSLRALRDVDALHVVQLAGRDPNWMRQAAERLAAEGADIIDINMGCPAKKVVGGLSGSALMREPDLALRIVEATVAGAGNVPVTLKMRLGWDSRSLNAPELAVAAEGAGVRMITVHGRTRAQFYEGRADWRAIAAVKRSVAVPVVANGDLRETGERLGMLARSEADAVMIGRGAQGRPWLPGMMAGAVSLHGLAGQSLAHLVEEHYEGILAHYGAAVGIRAARKHLGWYLDGFERSLGRTLAADRSTLLKLTDEVAIRRIIRDVFGKTSIADIERRATHLRAEAA